MGWVVKAKRRLLYPREGDPAPIVQVGLAPGSVWTGAANLAAT